MLERRVIWAHGDWCVVTQGLLYLVARRDPDGEWCGVTLEHSEERARWIASTLAAVPEQPDGPAQPETPAPRTMRVRVAVAVAPHGTYTVALSDREALAQLGCGDGRATWIEADVPLPDEPAVIHGRVVEEGERDG